MLKISNMQCYTFEIKVFQQMPKHLSDHVCEPFIPRKISKHLDRASDRVRQKIGNSAAFSREITRQERSIMWQIMLFF